MSHDQNRWAEKSSVNGHYFWTVNRPNVCPYREASGLQVGLVSDLNGEVSVGRLDCL